MLSMSSISKPASLAPVHGNISKLAARPKVAHVCVAHISTRRKGVVPCAASMGWAPVPPTPQAMQATVAAVAAAITAPVVARVAVACALGAGVRAFLAHANQQVSFPETALIAPTLQQRQNAVNIGGAMACLIGFLLFG